MTVAAGSPADVRRLSPIEMVVSNRPHVADLRVGVVGVLSTILQDAPRVRRMSRRASSTPSVRTLRHGTGSRRRLRQHSAAVTPAPRVSQLVDDARRSVLLHHVLGYEGNHRHAAERHRQDHAQRQGQPPGKLADAEIHFGDGVFAGLKLIGFAIWERRTGAGRNVTFPDRQYSVNGERRSFALRRPVADTNAQDSVRDLILAAYTEYEQAA